MATKGNQSENQFYFHDWYTNEELGDGYPLDPFFPPQNFQEGDNSAAAGEGISLNLVAVDVIINDTTGVDAFGKRYQVKISDALDYDLVGSLVQKS